MWSVNEKKRDSCKDPADEVCKLGAEDNKKTRDLNIMARRMRAHCQAVQLSNRAMLSLKETWGVQKGNDEVKKLKCKVTARNRRDRVISVSEVSWRRHEEIQPCDTQLLMLKPFPLNLA